MGHIVVEYLLAPGFLNIYIFGTYILHESMNRPDSH
jgi:hypothetical protein